MHIIKFGLNLLYIFANLLMSALIVNIFVKYPDLYDSFFNWYTICLSLILATLDRGLGNNLQKVQIALPILSLALSSYYPRYSSYMLYVAGATFTLLKMIGTYRIYQKFSSNKKNKGNFYTSYAWRKLRISILERDGRVCVSCGQSSTFDADGRPIQYHVDHIIPRSIDPSLELDPNNLQVMCSCCNLGKSNHYSNNLRRDRGFIPA